MVVPFGGMADAADLLKRAGASLADIVKVSICLTDANDFAAFNEAYARYFRKDPPARVSLVADLTIDARVEMDFVAYTGK